MSCCKNKSGQTLLLGLVPVVASIENIGTDLYSLTIQLVGTCSYLPYVCGCQCDICPTTDTIFKSITVPFYSTTTPNVTVTNPTVVLVSPTNVKDCSTKTNAVEIEFAFTVSNSTTETASVVMMPK